MKKPLKWIISNSLFMLPLLLLLVVICTLISICSVFFALLSRDVIDYAVSGESAKLFSEGLKLLCIIIIEIVLRIINSRMTVSFGGRLEMRLRENVFRSVLGKKWSEVNAYHSGEIVTRIKSDCSVITSGIMHILPNGAMFLTRVILALVVLFTIDMQFALIICTLSPLLILFGRIYSKKMKHFHKEVQQSEGKAVSYMLESIQNMTVVKAFGNEKNVCASLKEIQKETLALRLRRNVWNIASNVSMIILFTGGYAFAILWGAYRLSSNALSFGDFTAMIQLVNQVQSPFKSMGSLLVTYQNALASAERILELEALSDDFKEKQHSLKPIVDFDSIVFDRVSFSYGNDYILKDASIEIKKGDFAALCGISGAGKSTIIRLLLSLADPSEGRIYLKGSINRAVDASLRSLFGYVPQGNLLISGTIADNISFYSSATREEIERAAKNAQMDFAFNLPDGLDTLLGEKGSGLSEGQIQRIAIARALVRSTPILLLDEATSALDEETEIKLLEALRKEADKTVIIITHRKKVLDYCDKIITLTDGRLQLD